MQSPLINPIAEHKLLNAGLCALMSVDGNDLTPVVAARTSYRDFVEEHTDAENGNLVDYLIRKRHDTPVEFADVTFYMILPIFVARQLVRHRTASINEESLRYVEARPDYYIPSTEECKLQSKINKQGSDPNSLVEDPASVIDLIRHQGAHAHDIYGALLNTGLAKELCRTVLPLGQYTAWYWKANLRNVFHLLGLRCDSHAQEQIRVYANAMLEMVRPHFPNTVAAWENHVLNAVTFSADEWHFLSEAMLYNTTGEGVKPIALKLAAEGGMRKTRLAEFEAKLRR